MFLSFFFLSLAAAAPTKRQNAIPSNVPSYVVDYAPIVYLYSGEGYFPSDIGAQLTNTAPYLNYTNLNTTTPTLDNLSSLNNVPNSNDGIEIYLTSLLDPTTQPRPQYLYGTKPDATGLTPNAISSAIITHNHNNGTLDAYYFYFYAFNFGGVYFGLTVDNHIGDWEHNMLRFNTTTALPTQIFYSQHSSGEAFTYAATAKYNNGIRPITYSANGTHANYATPGAHDHTIPNFNLPFGPIEDHTDAGTLWDPTLSAYYYDWTPSTPLSDVGTFTAYDETTPVDWLNYVGRWGDEMIPESDPRQTCPFAITALCEYTSGPTGPEDKDLNRVNVCPDSQTDCTVHGILLPKRQEFEVWRGGVRVA